MSMKQPWVQTTMVTKRQVTQLLHALIGLSILIAYLLNNVMIFYAESSCQSLLGVKGLRRFVIITAKLLNNNQLTKKDK